MFNYRKNFNFKQEYKAVVSEILKLISSIAKLPYRKSAMLCTLAVLNWVETRHSNNNTCLMALCPDYPCEPVPER